VLLEAVVSSVSPLKNKRYVRELLDKTNAISFVGVDQHTQTKIRAMHKQQVPILLRNCDVQFNQYSKKLEVIVKDYTKIEVSKTTFDIENPEEEGAQTIQLTNLRDMPEYTKVNVQVKVIDLKEPQVAGKSKK